MVKVLYIIITILSFSINAFSQNIVSIGGVIRGLGTGKKVILGNKPNGINPGFVFVKFDSTFSYNDSFQFKEVKFKNPIYYSLEIEGSRGWKSFFIDNGIITVNGDIDSIYSAKVRGSKNNELIREYYNGVYNDWDIAHQKILKRLNSEIDSIKNIKILDTVIISINDYKNKTIEFYNQQVKKYPYPAFYLLRNINLNRYSDSFVFAKFKMLPAYVQKSPPLEDIYYRINFEKINLKTGKKIPNFIFQAENKNKTDLFNYKYKYKLLVFGASWCAPCINEIKELDSLNNLFQKKGLGILAINVDNNEEKWKVYTSYFKTQCLQLFTGNPSTSKIYKYFNINSIPFMALLDSKNQIIRSNIRLQEIENYIR